MPNELEEFFSMLNETAQHYVKWTSEVPKVLAINPDIIGKLARIEGFYQRDELATEVTIHAPVIRYLKLKTGIVTLYEDYEEKFYHFE